MKLLLSALTLSLACLAPTCQPPIPPAPPAPTDDAGTDTAPRPRLQGTCDADCQALARWGCEESGAGCVTTCVRWLDAGLAPYSHACVEGAASLSDLRSCPGIRCTRGAPATK